MAMVVGSLVFTVLIALAALAFLVVRKPWAARAGRAYPRDLFDATPYKAALALIRIPNDPSTAAAGPSPHDEFGTAFVVRGNGILLTTAHNLTEANEEGQPDPHGKPLAWVWVCLFDPSTGDWTVTLKADVDPSLIDADLDAALLRVHSARVTTPFSVGAEWTPGDDMVVLGFQPETGRISGFNVCFVMARIPTNWAVAPLDPRFGLQEPTLRLSFVDTDQVPLGQGVSGGPVLNLSRPGHPAVAIQKGVKLAHELRFPEISTTAIHWLRFKLFHPEAPATPSRKRMPDRLWMRVTRVAIIVLGLGAALWWTLELYRAPAIRLASTSLTDTWHPIVPIPWREYAGDFGNAWSGPGLSANSGEVDAWLGRLAADGVKGVAWFLLGDFRAGVEFARDGSGVPTGLTSAFEQDFDEAMRLLTKHDLEVVWIVADYKLAFPKEQQEGVQLFGRAALIGDQAAREALVETVMTWLAKRGSQEERIAGWVLINEPEHMLRQGYVSRQALQQFVAESTRVFHEHAPNQPLAIGYSDIESLMFLAPSDDLDFLILHHYGRTVPPPAHALFDVLTGPGPTRPIYIGEFNLNYPPSNAREGFIPWARASGFAGVWPWSLRNQATVTGDGAADVAPQFDLVARYAASVAESGRAGTEVPTQDSAVNRDDWRTATLVDLRARLERADGSRPSHLTGAKENLDWLNQVLDTLRSKEQERGPVDTDYQTAQANVDENTRWVEDAGHRLTDLETRLAAALEAADQTNAVHLRQLAALERQESSKARAGLAAARSWHEEKKQHLDQIDRTILQLRIDRTVAETRYRMHDYLQAETGASTENLKKLVALVDRGRPPATVTDPTSATDPRGATAQRGTGAPQVRAASLDGRDLRTCAEATPCRVEMLNARRLTLSLRLETRGYACVFVQTRGNSFPQPPGIVDSTAAEANPISFGGRGRFTLVVTTSDSAINCGETRPDGGVPGTEQLQASFEVS